MQLDALVFYAEDGRRREIKLRPGRLNVITGESRTGKSSLINIIRFCLGSDSPHAPHGVIRRSIAWYGLLAHVGETHFFIGRPAPHPDPNTSKAMLLVGTTEAPEFDDLAPNNSGDAIREYIGGLVGIQDNLHVPGPGQTRLPLAATLVHALYYCFQSQGEIANPDLLFHRQNREWQPQAIRDTLPYFLGALGLEDLRRRQELTELRRDLRTATSRLRQAESEREAGLGRAAGLLSEARENGLLPPGSNPAQLADARAALETAVNAVVDPIAAADASGGEFERLRDERNDLNHQLRELANQLRGLDDFAAVDDGYQTELKEQRSRLVSVGLVADSADTDVRCALCQRPLGEHDEDAQLAITQALALVDRRLEHASRDKPRVEVARNEILAARNEVRRRLSEIEQALGALTSADDTVKVARDAFNVQGYVRGRIAQYLEMTELTEDNELAGLRERVATLEGKAEALEELLDPRELRSRVESRLARVNRATTDLAVRLKLEHAETGVRIDLDRLTIVADTDEGAAFMDRGEIGSGMNWVGYHLAAYLALQEYFINHTRPVPAFLVLDQPSQAFFPRDRKRGGDLGELKDVDRENTRKLYALIAEVIEQLDGRLQVLALDHADFEDEWFSSAIVEEWRAGKALVPRNWLSPETHLAEIRDRFENEEEREYRATVEGVVAEAVEALTLEIGDAVTVVRSRQASIDNVSLQSVMDVGDISFEAAHATDDPDVVSLRLTVPATVTFTFTTDASGAEWLADEHADVEVDVQEETFVQMSTLARAIVVAFDVDYSTVARTLGELVKVEARDARQD